jgi:hypothetical protein
MANALRVLEDYYKVIIPISHSFDQEDRDTNIVVDHVIAKNVID